MSSWTDKTPTFSPYVQQLPVESMVNVGVQKQQKYNEGIQKIQSSIDNIAGLDIIKDGHRVYLQSKLDELGSNLKTVAAGDFSNFQLVNSVSGMTRQIVRDPVIQNAVYSTQVIRKGQSEMEAARKVGKSSVQNEEWWNNQVNSWQNDGDLRKQFNGTYVPYTDIDKKLREVADKIKESDSSVDIPFKRDASGNVIAGKDGKPIIDDAMLRITTKGRPAEKILANFYDSLNENDQRQLQIDSWYHYRGATKDTFKRDIVANYNNNRKITEDAILNLNVELQTNPKLSSSQRSDIQAKIKSLNEVLTSGSLDSEMRKQLSDIDNLTDIDTYKYKIYTQKYLTNLAKDMSNESYKQEILSNPYAQMDMEKRRLQFSYDNAAREQRNWERSYALSVQKWMAERQDKLMEQREKEAEAQGAPVTPDALPTDVDVPTLGKLQKSIDATKVQIDELNAQYAPLISDPTINTPEKKKAYLDGIVSAYAKNPASIVGRGNNMIEYIERRRNLDLELAKKNNLYTSTQEASKKIDAEMDKVFAAEKGVITPDGKKLSPKELFEVANDYYNRIMSVPKAGLEFGTPSLNAKEFFSTYKGTNKEFLATAFARRASAVPLSEPEKAAVSMAMKLQDKYASEAGKAVVKKLDVQSDYLSKYMPERQSMIGGLDPKNKKDIRQITYLLENKLEQYRTYGALDRESKKDFDPGEIANFMKDPNTMYTVRKKYDGSAELVLSSKGKHQIVPITASELPKFFPNVAKNSPFNDMKELINSSPNRTTNLNGGSNPANAVNAYLSGHSSLIPFLNNTDYASLVRFDINGSASNTGGEGDRYEVVMYVNDGGTWKMDVLNKKGFVNEASVQEILSKIDPSIVNEFLKRNK